MSVLKEFFEIRKNNYDYILYILSAFAACDVISNIIYEKELLETMQELHYQNYVIISVLFIVTFFGSKYIKNLFKICWAIYKIYKSNTEPNSYPDLFFTLNELLEDAIETNNAVKYQYFVNEIKKQKQNTDLADLCFFSFWSFLISYNCKFIIYQIFSIHVIFKYIFALILFVLFMNGLRNYNDGSKATIIKKANKKDAMSV